MNIETMTMFIDVVETGSMVQSAQRLHISQPALTQQMKTMEKQLGVQLLHRSNKGVTPTPAGEVLYRAALDICESYRKVCGDLKALQSQHKTLRVAATNLVYTYALPCTLFDLKEKFPDYHLDIGLFPSEQVEQRVIGGKADIGFIVGLPKEQRLIAKPVVTNRICLVAGNDFSFDRPLTVAELYQKPLLMLTNSHRSRQLLDHALIALHVDIDRLQIPHSFNSTESIRQAVINGFGLAFLPYAAIKKDLYSEHLHTVALEGFSLDLACCLIASPTLLEADSELARLISYLEKTLEDTVC